MTRSKTVGALSALSLAASLAAASTASADTLGQAVTGTAGSSLALTAETPAAFATAFTPGASGLTSSAGTLTAVDTTPTWSLTVKDGTTGGDGHLKAAVSTACTNSESELGNASVVNVVPAVANASITAGVDKTIPANSASAAQVATATAVPLAATVFNTTYKQSIGASEVLQNLCAYSLTSTYTLA